MSEQAKAVLQEKMKDANKNMFVSLVPMILGINFIGFGLTGERFSFQTILMQITLGVACVIIGICMQYLTFVNTINLRKN